MAWELYRGDLLEGLHLSDAPAFERWLDVRRAELKRLALWAAQRFAGQQIDAGDSAAAASTLRTALSLAPTDEAVARELMEVLIDTGRANRALALYREVASTFEDLGAAPPAALSALARTLEPVLPIRSLAVVPWANLTGQADQEHLADGFTDLLITELARTHPGRVISRQSSLQLKSSNLPLSEVADCWAWTRS
jgi:DNA-binding SARP family transcriptional activator